MTRQMTATELSVRAQDSEGRHTTGLLDGVRAARTMLPRLIFDQWLDEYVATLYDADADIHGWYMPASVSKARRILSRYVNVRDAARRERTTDPFPYRIDSRRMAYPCVMDGRRAVWDPRSEFEVTP